MPDSLMPGVRQVHATRDGGSMVGGPPRVVWHTTEYGFDPLDIAHDLNRNGTQVHLVWQPKTGDIVQLVSAHRAGRGLENDDGWPQTNRMGLVCIQIEVVADAADPFTDTEMKNLGRILDWLDSWGIPREWPAGRPGGSEMYGPNPQRSARTWTRHAGHYGHSQVPENCVSADTPVLCADLVWRPAGDLLPGDELIAFDEENTQHWGRTLRSSTVVNNAVTRDALLVVHTPMGSVRCNYQHPWLTRRGWVKARELVPGDELWWFGRPWPTDRSWEAGWLAGMYDGDGCLSLAKNKTTLLVLSQRESETAETMARLVKERADGVSVVHRAFGSIRTAMVQVQIGSRWESMRMLGTVRPPRLLATSRRIWDGGSANRARQFIPVDSIEGAGTGLIASLETSSATYIAAGFAMHNSHWDPGRIDIDKLLQGGDDVSARDVFKWDRIRVPWKGKGDKNRNWQFGHAVESAWDNAYKANKGVREMRAEVRAELRAIRQGLDAEQTRQLVAETVRVELDQFEAELADAEVVLRTEEEAQS